MRARGERFERHRRVMFGVGVDRDGVGLERFERLGQVVKARDTSELLVEIAARRGVAGAQAHELEAVDRLIGACVAHPHGAEANDEDALGPRDVRIWRVAHRCFPALGSRR
jgi:hypothetical protein